MRYFLCAILVFGQLLPSQAQDRLSILASASMFADMAKNIIGDKHAVDLIVPVGGDPHIYEPTPGDAKKVAEADLIFMNGMTFEGWISELISNSGTKAQTVLITEGITPISSSVYDNSNDPHAWMSATNGLRYIVNIYNAIIKVDPLNAAYYQKNYENYKAELITLDRYIKQQIASIPEKNKYLITSHDAFAYYGKEYDIDVEAILGTSTDADAQTSDLMRISKLIKENNIPAIFVESTVNPKLIEQIASAQKTSIGGSLYSDSLGKKGSSGDTYLKMLRHNTDTIVRALQQEAPAAQEKSAFSPWWYVLIGVGLIGILALFLKKL